MQSEVPQCNTYCLSKLFSRVEILNKYDINVQISYYLFGITHLFNSLDRFTYLFYLSFYFIGRKKLSMCLYSQKIFNFNMFYIPVRFLSNLRIFYLYA